MTALTGSTGAVRLGSVASFDSDRGLGEIEADGCTYPFHCTEISDGTRRVEVGAAVRFVESARFGRIEAARIEAAGIEAARIEAARVETVQA